MGFKSFYTFVLHLIVFIQSFLLWRSYNIVDTTHVGPVEGSSWCTYAHPPPSAQCSNNVSAPARDFLEYEVIDTPASGHVSASKFWGPPDAEQDEAWDQLIRRMRILQAFTFLTQC